MAVEISTGTPMAKALQSLIQPKLEALEWSLGGDDITMSEYIVMMLANGKTQDEIASDLFNDFKDLGADEASATEFSRWLFEQVQSLQNQSNPTAQPQGSGVEDTMQGGTSDGSADENAGQDTLMGDANESASPAIPTGPRAMRNNNTKQRNGRLPGQMNKTTDRSDSALHRVRGTSGTGRINAHSNREPPKGPRNQGNRNAQLNQMVAGGPMARGQMPMGPMGQGSQFNPMNSMSSMTPEQQMQMFAYWEEGARMMQQMFNMQGAGGPVMNPSFQQNNPQQGKSLFDRVQGRQPKPNGHFNGRSHHHKSNAQKTESHDTVMGGSNSELANADESATMDMDGSQASKDPSDVVCKFNLSCTKFDCPYAHQSPAAPAGTSIDMHDVCSYGAACKNHKCVGRHPSPAKRAAFQAEQDCRYGPNCTNPSCPFKHSTMPLCRNGADCKIANCKFTHSKIFCKFNPCLNPHCTYKHSEDQKRGTFGDKVWTPGEENKEHVSERKFTDEGVEEELILPGRSDLESVDAANIVT